MKTRGVIGKKIVAVNQSRLCDKFGHPTYHIDSIDLEDGSSIGFVVVETGDDYLIEAVLAKRRKETTA